MLFRVSRQADERSFDGAHVAQVFDAEESPTYIKVEEEDCAGRQQGRDAGLNAFQ